MAIRSTPLGFLPAELDLRSHCMFIYPRKDEVFVDNIARFLAAGIGAGEMCLCLVQSPAAEHVCQRLNELGVDAALVCASGQLSIEDPARVYTHGGVFDIPRVREFWIREYNIARDKWNGLRVFGDSEVALGNPIMRLKLLEYESIVNLGFLLNVGMCGYQSSIATRSLLTHAKSVHPIIANSRSVQTNHAYVEPSRFLAGFYKFRRITRVYSADGRYARRMRRDLEDVAARTPLTMTEIQEIRVAAGEAFSNAIEHGCGRLDPGEAHIHVSFEPQPDAFVIRVRDHGPGFELADGDLPAPEDDRNRGIHLMRGFMDDVSVRRVGGDTVVTMSRSYSATFASSHASSS